MTYRPPRTLPYLSAVLSAALMAGLFFAPNPNGPVTPLGYVRDALDLLGTPRDG